MSRSALSSLAAPVVDPVRNAHEGYDDILFGGLVEQHLGVTGGNDLATAPGRHLCQQPINLPLPENLQVRIGFVEQQDGARVRIQVSQQQERLLQAAAG